MGHEATQRRLHAGDDLDEVVVGECVVVLHNMAYSVTTVPFAQTVAETNNHVVGRRDGATGVRMQKHMFRLS